MKKNTRHTPSARRKISDGQRRSWAARTAETSRLRQEHAEIIELRKAIRESGQRRRTEGEELKKSLRASIRASLRLPPEADDA
jgi:hypothetical protein